MIKNLIILGLIAWLIYAIGLNKFFDNIRTTVDKVEEIVDNKDKLIDNLDIESEEE